MKSYKTPSAEPPYYLALGDSYTIGESVEPEESFPLRLREALRGRDIELGRTDIIAKTGWTTDELLEKVRSRRRLADRYDLVTLLIGVNNQYRGYTIEQYERELATLMELAVEFAGGEPTHVVVLSIPDYAYTPFGQARDFAKITYEINWYNSVAEDMAARAGIPYLDITPTTRRGLVAPELVAEDALHPSAALYRRWVDLLLPMVLDILETRPEATKPANQTSAPTSDDSSDDSTNES